MLFSCYGFIGIAGADVPCSNVNLFIGATQNNFR
jgi:hypothetical protein